MEKENINQVKELIDLLKENELTVIEVQSGDAKIRVEQAGTPIFSQAVVSPPPPTTSVDTVSIDPKESVENEEKTKTFSVKSPLVGAFYVSHTPGEAPMVKAGQKVVEGDVLCIIESMKVMNEISTPKAGTVREVLVNDGDIVQYDQKLFVIEE
jgi:acetyl-CoA carboxylase, biotin carboxyl carrier protein